MIVTKYLYQQLKQMHKLPDFIKMYAPLGHAGSICHNLGHLIGKIGEV